MKLPLEVESVLSAAGICTYPTNLARAEQWLATERRRRAILETTYQHALAAHGEAGAKPHANALEDSDTAIRWLEQLCADFAKAPAPAAVPAKKKSAGFRGFIRQTLGLDTGR